MKTRMHARFLTLLIILIFALCGSGIAESYSANTMRLLRYEGQVEIEDASGKSRFIMENARFSSGESMKTGPSSYASVSLDSSKILTLDAQSRVEFAKTSNTLVMKLTQGALLLDVQEKLDENESLDIQTSTMVVGIRGTIVFLRVEEDDSDSEAPGETEDAAGQATMLGVLEGTAQLTYRDDTGVQRRIDVPAGQMAALSDPDQDGLIDAAPALNTMTAQDVPGFVMQEIERDPRLKDRINSACDVLNSSSGESEPSTYPYSADGSWTWNGNITLVAQSASKLYDSQALTRPSDVLVYGLPAEFSIRASAGGSQTDAGTAVNPITHYEIYNAVGENVTSHFSGIETVAGVLTVDPAPLTVWTASAEKEYDGTELTEPEALLLTYPGYERDAPIWRNSSYVVTEAAGSQTLYGVSGVTWTHGTNPLTGETQELLLYAGQKLSVHLSEANGEESIEFRIENFTESEIPEDLLRLYADNPELLSQACTDTGWDISQVRQRIRELPAKEYETVVQDQLLVEEESSERLMLNSTNVRITIDTEITSYNGRALNGEEAHYTPVRLDEGIHVTATGTQTPVGESTNTYEIDWGGVNPANYILSEELGTLTVVPNTTPITLTASSAEKAYDGSPLRRAKVLVDGLPEGFTLTAQAEGSRTDAGLGVNRVSSYSIQNAEGEDVTDFFSNMNIQDGSLTVSTVPLTIVTSSASKEYDGTPLTSPDAQITGLVNGELATVTATGSQTEAGSSENTYSLTWNTAYANNYRITENLGTLTVTVPGLVLTSASADKVYDGQPLTSSEVTVEGLPEGFTCQVSAVGSRTDAGTSENTIGDFRILNADGTDVTAGFTDVTKHAGTLTVLPAPLTVVTGSAEKAYDGQPLTSAEAQLVGLIADEEAGVTATGSQTAVGTAANTYQISWGSAKAGNYEVTEELGQLTVTPNSTLITIASGDGYMRYKPWDCIVTNSEYTVSGLPAGFTLNASITGEQAWDVGSSPNTIDSWTILSPEGEDATDFFTNVQKSEGTLTIDRAIVTIWSDDVTKVYDRYAAAPTIHWTGIYGMDNAQNGIRITHASLQIDVGSSRDSFSVTWIYPELESLYEIQENPGLMTVTPCEITIVTGSAEKIYDGTPLTSSEASVTGGVYGEPITVTANGSITDIGSTQNTYTINWGSAKASNYTITEQLGTLTVTSNNTAIVFTAASASREYDGTALTTTDYTVTGVPAGYTHSATVTGFQTAVGSSDSIISAIHIYDSTGNNVSHIFTNITTVNGTLTVTPRPLTITSGSASKTFDGTPLTSSEYTVSGLVGADSVQVVTSGTITDAGTAENTFTYTLDGNPANYTVTTVTGTLLVNRNGSAITITSGSASRVYNAQPLTESSYTVSGLPSGFTCTAYVSGSQTGVGTSANTISGYTILDSASRNVTGNFSNVSTAAGQLAVTPAEITVTTESAKKVYDGTPLTNPNASISGLVGGETATVTATGSITELGITVNTYTISWGTASSGNYTIIENLGELEILASD